MNNLYTYTIELRDRLSSSLRRAGGSVIETTRRIRDLRRNADSLNRMQFTGFSNGIRNALSSIPFSNIFTNPFVIAGAVAGRTLKLGIAQEMQNASFEVLLGGEDNARKMIDNIAAYASKSTYGKETLSGAVQTMAGFGIDANRIMPNLRAIGEIAMGNKPKFDSLTLAFSQMMATGSLMGQDLLQMVNAGFNPLMQISKDTGKSVAALKDEMSKGRISADMVAAAFRNATKEGGMFYGMSDKMSLTLGGALSTAMSNINDRLLKLYDIIQPYLLPAVRAFNMLLTDTGLFIDKLVVRISNMSTTARVVGGVILWLGATIAAYKTVMGIVTLATKAWAVAQGILNAVLTLNPVGIVIAGVVALIALIAFLIIKIDGWGDTWANVMKLCSLVFDSFKGNLELKWLQIKNLFFDGLAAIEKGWYKLQSLWDSDAANAGLASLENERNARAAEIAEKHGKLEQLSKELSALKVVQLKVNDTSLSDVANNLKSKLGISPAGIAGMDTSDTGGTGAGGGTNKAGKASGKTANSIATGGSKTTHITINLGNLVGTMTVTAGNVSEGAQKVRDIVLDELSRALTMAQANV